MFFMSTYAHPEFLVNTSWAADHLSDPKIKFIEVDVDTSAYDKGHLPGAIGWNWQTDLNDRVRRDIIDPRSFAELNRRFGIQPSTPSFLWRQQQLVRRVGAVAVQISRTQGCPPAGWRSQEMGAGAASIHAGAAENFRCEQLSDSGPGRNDPRLSQRRRADSWREKRESRRCAQSR
jgi:hypothetical protein